MSDNPVKLRMDLPPENWVDIFACIPRRLVANNLALACRKLSAIADYWLNEKCDKICIKKLEIAENGDGQMEIWNQWGEAVPPPQVDIPPNIVDFGTIHIDLGANSISTCKAFSARMKPILDLLAKMGNLLANSNIHIVEGNEEGDSSEEEDEGAEEDEELFAIVKMGKCANGTALNMLLPVLGGHPVQSVRCIPGNGLLNPPNYFCSLFTKLHVLHLEGERNLNDEALDFLTYWITDSNYPMLEGAADSRILIVTLSDVDASEIIWRLRQKFFTQNRTANFFVRMKISNRTLRPLPEFSMKRNEPDEVFNLEKLDNDRFLLGRYPANANEDWLEKRREQALWWNFDGQKRRIILKI